VFLVPVCNALLPETATDDLGRDVYIARVPERIVSLSPANTEMLFALGLADRVVGVTEYCNFPHDVEALKQAGRLTVVGGFKDPDLEKIAVLEPDLILASKIHANGAVPALEKAGYTVFVVRPNNLSEVLESIKKVGVIAGKEEYARNLTDQMVEKINAVSSRVSGQEKRRVLYLVWHDPVKTAGKGTFEDELIGCAGGVNIFQELDGYALVDVEAIAAKDPEVIIACTGMGDGMNGTYQWAMDEPVLKETTARRTDRVYPAQGDLITRAGPRIVDALDIFARLIHPEAF
jgi:iron complex transport system substrate-binding protein